MSFRWMKSVCLKFRYAYKEECAFLDSIVIYFFRRRNAGTPNSSFSIAEG